MTPKTSSTTPPPADGARSFRRFEIGFAEHYAQACRFALFLQAILGLLTALLLDGGRVFWAFCVAWLWAWTISLMIIFRRPANPSRLDLGIVRYGILVLLTLILGLGPWFLRVMGPSPELIK